MAIHYCNGSIIGPCYSYSACVTAFRLFRAAVVENNLSQADRETKGTLTKGGLALLVFYVTAKSLVIELHNIFMHFV